MQALYRFKLVYGFLVVVLDVYSVKFLLIATCISLLFAPKNKLHYDSLEEDICNASAVFFCKNFL